MSSSPLEGGGGGPDGPAASELGGGEEGAGGAEPAAGGRTGRHERHADAGAAALGRGAHAKGERQETTL